MLKRVLHRSLSVVSSAALVRLGSNSTPSEPRTIPLDVYDLSGITPVYTSGEIDTWFNGIVDLGEPYPVELTVVNQSNPTSASQTSRQTLFDAYVLVNYNPDFTP